MNEEENSIIGKLDADDFTLRTFGCIFDIVSDETGNKYLSVTPDRNKINLYAISPSRGLCRVTHGGYIYESHLITKLISLSDEDSKEVYSFFEEYGFPVTLPRRDNLRLDLSSFWKTVERVKVTALLKIELDSEHPRVPLVLRYMLYLILSDRVVLTVDDVPRFQTCKHSVKALLEDNNYSLSYYSDTSKPQKEGYACIPDTIFTDGYYLEEDEYNDIISGESFMYEYPGIHDPLYKNLTLSYRNAVHESKANRTVLDCLFHYMHEVGVIKAVRLDTGIEYYNQPKLENYTPVLKNATISAAKVVLANEINFYIAKISPVFDPNTMTHTWKAPNLISAMYFSLSYMRPGRQIMRECANPRCHHYFVVNITNDKKIYCSAKCRNAAEQREFRKNHK